MNDGTWPDAQPGWVVMPATTQPEGPPRPAGLEHVQGGWPLQPLAARDVSPDTSAASAAPTPAGHASPTPATPTPGTPATPPVGLAPPTYASPTSPATAADVDPPPGAGPSPGPVIEPVELEERQASFLEATDSFRGHLRSQASGVANALEDLRQAGASLGTAAVACTAASVAIATAMDSCATLLEDLRLAGIKSVRAEAAGVALVQAGHDLAESANALRAPVATTGQAPASSTQPGPLQEP